MPQRVRNYFAIFWTLSWRERLTLARNAGMVATAIGLVIAGTRAYMDGSGPAEFVMEGLLFSVAMFPTMAWGEYDSTYKQPERWRRAREQRAARTRTDR